MNAPTPPIRAAKWDDLESIDAIDREAFSDMPYQDDMLRQQFYMHREGLLVAEVDGKVRGYLILASPPDRDAWILSMAVSAAGNYHRQGYGRMLLETALEQCRANQFERVCLTVHPDNQAAKNLYKRAQFELIDYEDEYLGPGEPREKYVLILDRGSERREAAQGLPRAWEILTESQKPVYRIAELRDLEAIAQIEEKSMDQPYPRFVLRQLFDVYGESWLVVEVAGSVLGYLLVALTLKRRAWLLSFAVEPGSRKRDYGAELLDRALRLCRELSVGSVYTVRPTNKSARDLYERADFMQNRHEQPYFGPGEPRDVLIRTLL